jgi:serine phosphatase RsbU (regulator of sigma subunit)
VNGEAQLLRDKAMLLLQRERELHEARLELDQIAVWLSIGQVLPELFLARGRHDVVWQRVRRLLLHELRLQRVLVLEVHADTLRPLAPAGPDRALAIEARLLLDARPWGLCNDPQPGTDGAGLPALAQALDLHQFMWSRITCPEGPPILLVGGFDRDKCVFQLPFTDNDAGYFNNAAQHMESLLANALFVAALQSAAADLRAANETLEQRVRERTLELRNRNRELRELPHRIQTSMLPKRTTAASISIAARMRTAEEVGGDYYDVLPAADGAWVAVGDVSGHGLEAGLLTFMLQSALTALLAAHPAARPSELVTLLNTVMYKNARQRLGSDDYVTFVLLRVFACGRVVFAGSHESLIIRRAATGRCETVETHGAWLGTKPDIGSVTSDAELRLGAGDLLVVFTDGLIEARNADREMFGIERLCAEVEAATESSTEELADRIVGRAAAWCPRPEDDISLVLVRFGG